MQQVTSTSARLHLCGLSVTGAPGVSVSAEYLQVFPEYQQMAAIVNWYNRTIDHVALDVNCLFRALAHQAFGDKTYHTQMWKVLVMLISDNLQRYKFLYMGRRNGFEEHDDMMSMGTQLEMQAVADCLGVPEYELMYCSATNSHK